MNLYKITIRNYHEKASTKSIEIIVYAPDSTTALQTFVDLAFDTTEPCQHEIRTFLLFIFEDTYYDDSFDTDALLEPNNAYDYHRPHPLWYIHEDTFLTENRDNYKVFLEKYLTEFDDYITVQLLRISNQPTLTKRAH